MAQESTSSMNAVAASLSRVVETTERIVQSYRDMNATYTTVNAMLLQRVREIYGDELSLQIGVLKTWWWKRTGKFDQVVTARLRLEGLIPDSTYE